MSWYPRWVRYFIQYPAGTSELVTGAVSTYVKNFSVRYRDDSAMIFDSTSSAEQVAQIPFAKNAFLVVETTPRRGVNQSARKLSKSLRKELFPTSRGRPAGFRIMAHIDGELSPVDPGAKRDVEQAVSSCTGGRVEPRGMCQEYWLIGRLDLADLLFCARLPKVTRPKKARGAVSYELSAMLVQASTPSRRDAFLDPFGGSGSFVLARLDSPAREITYSDTDLSFHRKGFPSELIRNRRVRLLSEDALTLPSIPDGSIDVIVTDPPWGEHEELSIPYPDFANAVAESFNRVLNPVTGRFVLLCARRSASLFRGRLDNLAFTISAAHEILVNGHPATVLVGGRREVESREATESGRDLAQAGQRSPSGSPHPSTSTPRRATNRSPRSGGRGGE